MKCNIFYDSKGRNYMVELFKVKESELLTQCYLFMFSIEDYHNINKWEDTDINYESFLKHIDKFYIENKGTIEVPDYMIARRMLVK